MLWLESAPFKWKIVVFALKCVNREWYMSSCLRVWKWRPNRWKPQMSTPFSHILSLYKKMSWLICTKVNIALRHKMKRAQEMQCATTNVPWHVAFMCRQSSPNNHTQKYSNCYTFFLALWHFLLAVAGVCCAGYVRSSVCFVVCDFTPVALCAVAHMVIWLIRLGCSGNRRQRQKCRMILS